MQLYTKGYRECKAGPSPTRRGEKSFSEYGGELKEFYMVFGRYDMVVVADVPNDEAAAKLALAIGSGGALRSETLRAFTEDEYRKIVSALP